MVYKIHKAKKQDHLRNHRAIRKVTGKIVATQWITDYLEYLFPQSSRRIQHARTKSRGWSRSPRTTNIENHPFRMWARRRRSSSSAKNRKTDLNNTEVFELYENSSKQQCPDWNAYCEVGIFYCSCGRNMKSARSPAEFNQNNRDVTSISGRTVWKAKDVLPDETDA